ncbi:integrase, partial [Yersinia ruckeri ATCC 29473]
MHLPVKFRLEFMAIVCPDGFYSERKFIHNVINKINRIGLIMP